VVATASVVVAAAVTTVEVMTNGLDELDELDELELGELDELVVLWVTAGGYSTAYKVTTLQVDPRLY
jgi:hypothetical protein